MELLYLWVEDYKNIKQQGFNFSPRFECSYDEKTNELTIDKKEDYVDIFPDNINVTAIVGENGSGKSSILEIIDAIFEDRHPNTNFLLILNDDTLSYISNFYETTKLEKYLQYSIERYLYLANKQTLDNYSLQENGEHFQYRILFNENLIANMLCDKYISSIDFQLTSFMYIPHIIEIKPTLNNLINDLTSNERFNYSHMENIFDEDLTDKQEDKRYKEIRNQQFAKEDNLNHLFYESHLDEYHKFLIYLFIREYGYDDNDYQLEDIQFLIAELKDFDYFLDETSFQTFFQKQILSTDEFTDETKTIYFKYYQKFFDFDFIDKQNRRYKDLSHGEQTIFGLLLNIYYLLQANQKSTLFLLDEPDLALHPQWQKNFLYEIVNTFSKIEKHIHFIITSHSPFILSDLAKENVIFLKAGEQVDVDINPFGANIHTLLSHGFFMKDGLMGEFAKGKIQNVINFLSDKETDLKKEDIYPIIDLIGEPFLKQKLKEQYFIKYPKERNIDNEIDILEKKLTELKNAKNSN